MQRSHWNGYEWIISIAEGDSPARQRFTLLHEFKHIIDHGHTHTGSTPGVIAGVASPLPSKPSRPPTTSLAAPSCPVAPSRAHGATACSELRTWPSTSASVWLPLKCASTKPAWLANVTPSHRSGRRVARGQSEHRAGNPSASRSPDRATHEGDGHDRTAGR